MRCAVTAFVLAGALMAGGPSQAQNTSSPSTTPKQTTAPVGHRQPRPGDLGVTPTPSNPPSSAPAPEMTGDDLLDPDGRLERALKSICRGC